MRQAEEEKKNFQSCLFIKQHCLASYSTAALRRKPRLYGVCAALLPTKGCCGAMEARMEGDGVRGVEERIYSYSLLLSEW